MQLYKKEPISHMKLSLLSQDCTPRNIGEEWVISIKEPTISRFLRPFGLKINKTVNIGIKDIKAPIDELKMDTTRLFSLRVYGERFDADGTNEKEITLTSLHTQFQLFFHPDAITDSFNRQKDIDKLYQISFRVVLTNDKDEEITGSDEVIQLQLDEVHTRPMVKIEIAPRFKSFMYSRSFRKETIGHLVISNPAELYYFPTLDMKGCLSVVLNGTDKGNDLFYLDFENADIRDSNCRCTETNRFLVEDFESTALGRARAIRIPIVADVQKIGNPYEAAKRAYSVELELTYRHHGEVNSDVLKLQATVTVLRDAKKAELHVYAEGNELLDNGTMEFGRQKFLYGSGMRHVFPIVIRNTADSGLPHAGLIVGDLNHEVQYEEDNVIATYSRMRMGTKDVFHFDNANGSNGFDRLSAGRLQLDSCPNSSLALQLVFDDNDILELLHIRDRKRNYNVTAVVKMKLHYWINDQGDVVDVVAAGTPSVFTATLRIPLFQESNPKWLGIDFGTSAIVCQYAGTLLKLHSQKKRIFEIPNTPEGEKDDRFEIGSEFLSSNTVFRQNARLPQEVAISQLLSQANDHEPDYHSLAVCLSPTGREEDINSRYALPCLKLMVGYKYLPNLELYLDQRNPFVYGVRSYDNTTVKKLKLKELEDGEMEYTALAEVDKVFEEVYRELFLYYICKCLPRDVSFKQLNRLVLTIPNTYTPRHVEKLEEIVGLSFNNQSIRDVCFVSESDAVACYYQKNRAASNRAIGRTLEQIKSLENVLVYDMGAGTLDLTLFSRNEQLLNGRTSVNIEVKGRIGIAKAGNYLDYVLAKILVDILATKDQRIADRMNNFIDNIGNDNARLLAGRALKSFVKEELKPALSSGQATITLHKAEKVYAPLGLTADLTFEIAVITQHPMFKRYIEDCTQSLIGNFFAFLGLNRQSFKLDTVILSGRSSKLKYIREALDDTIQKWKSNNFAVIDTSSAGSDKAKTAVVEGAMAFADWVHDEAPTVKFREDNITACFGVIYQDANGEDHYVELLNPRKEKPIDVVMHKGIRVKTYLTDDVTLDLSSTDRLQLIQTYSAQTEADWKAQPRKMDYISKVEEFPTHAFPHRSQTQLHIEVDGQNMLRLVVNTAQSMGLAPNKIELSNSSISRSLWPMLQAQQNNN